MGYDDRMPKNLIRYQQSGDLHFITFSCYQRQTYLASPEALCLFEKSLEAMRLRYDFWVTGYVVMPEHVHLLISEPQQIPLSKALQALKLSVAVRRPERPFWQARYYDFNVFSEKKQIEKLRYSHRNPVTCVWYRSHGIGHGQVFVTISMESWARLRLSRNGRRFAGSEGKNSTSQKRDVGHPRINTLWSVSLA
jgi:putative transposase